MATFEEMLGEERDLWDAFWHVNIRPEACRGYWRIRITKSRIKQKAGGSNDALLDDGGDTSNSRAGSRASKTSETGESAGEAEGESKVELAGTREGLASLWELVHFVAPTDARVLITGESGTGKNLLAEALHLLHPKRWTHNFRRTNLGALVPDLAASQLFGHEKGAFTSATTSSEGIVREANRGTLFLDQLSDASDNVQEMLLTLLEVKRINPVGARANTPRPKVDVRLVTACIESPEQLKRLKRFRSDLYYRIMEYPIAVPPLRNRPDEILALARYFLDKAAPLRSPPHEKSKERKSPLQDLSAAAQQRLLEYRWPGNVRELDHVIRAAVVASRAAPAAEELDVRWFRFPDEPSEIADLPIDTSIGYKEALARFSHAWAKRMLGECGGDNNKAARRMGISNDTYRKYRDWPGRG